MYERLQEILRLLEDPSNVDNDALAELETELTQIFDQLLEDDAETAEDRAQRVQALTECADAIDGVRFVAGERIEADRVEREAEEVRKAEEAEAIAALERRVKGDAEPNEEELDEDGAPVLKAEGEDKDEESDDPDHPNVEVDKSKLEESDDDEEVEDRELEPVAAGSEGAPPAPAPPAPAAPAVASRADLNDRQRKDRQPQARTRPRVRIRAAGLGGHFKDRVGVEDALLDRWFDLQGTGETGRRRVATFELPFPEKYVLPEGRDTDVNDIALEIRARAMEPGGVEALTADGGLCGPVDVYNGLQTIAQASRPLRASIANYQAKRGGINFMTPIKLSDIQTATTPTSGRAIGVVTEAQDAASTYDKSYQVVPCGTMVEKHVDAVYMQLEFGRFFERTNPERKSQFTDLTLAAFARFNEQRLFNAMVTNSRHTNGAQKLGAMRDLLNGLNRAAINFRSIHRMDQTATLETVLPTWVGMGLLPDDQVNSLQSYPEQFEVTAARVEQLLGLRNIRVTWFQDDFTTDLVAEGGVNAYPSTFKALLYHPGAHVIVDSGELNLGVLVDSVLAVNNTFRTFNEEFWTTAMWGVDSWDIEFSLCENGASAGSRTPTCGS